MLHVGVYVCGREFESGKCLHNKKAHEVAYLQIKAVISLKKYLSIVDT